MPRRLIWLLLLLPLLLPVWPCLAGQASDVHTYVAPTGAGQSQDDQSIYTELVKQLEQIKPVQSKGEGLGTVPASQASLCPVCGQPLYKHAEPGFVCAPPDKKLLDDQDHARAMPGLPGAVRGRAAGQRERQGRAATATSARHSIGKYSVHSNVWICPDCGYAALHPPGPARRGALRWDWTASRLIRPPRISCASIFQNRCANG